MSKSLTYKVWQEGKNARHDILYLKKVQGPKKDLTLQRNTYVLGILQGVGFDCVCYPYKVSK